MITYYDISSTSGANVTYQIISICNGLYAILFKNQLWQKWKKEYKIVISHSASILSLISMDAVQHSRATRTFYDATLLARWLSDFLNMNGMDCIMTDNMAYIRQCQDIITVVICYVTQHVYHIVHIFHRSVTDRNYVMIIYV